MNKIKGMFMVLSFTFFLMVSLVINVSFSIWMANSGLSITYQKVLVYTFSIISMFLGFFVLYKFSPRFKIRFRDVVPGAMITTIPTAGFILLFGTITQL